jgi:hypothetical protein
MTQELTLKLSDQQLVLLARGMVQSMFDMVVRGPVPAAPELPSAASISPLPAIGTEVNGEIYAGLTIHDNQPMALWLLPGDEKLKWADAVAWAEKQGGVLPSRIDQLVLFKNVKDQFQQAWYWSGEQYGPGSGYAWSQGFTDGYQSYGLKGYGTRARAVRRSVIQ